MNPTTHQPHRARRLRRVLHTYTWAGAAALAVPAYMVLETAGFGHP